MDSLSRTMDEMNSKLGLQLDNLRREHLSEATSLNESIKRILQRADETKDVATHNSKMASSILERV